MRATLNLPPSVRLIEAALEGLVQVNRVLIETGVVPPSPLDARVRYRRESSGLEEWDNAAICLQRGWGDCEDLNSWECARINIDEDPEAICTLIQTGARMFHCVVLMSDGSLRDICPSLGMRVPGTSLEGVPWLETRSENIIGGTRVPRLPAAIRNVLPQARVPYRPKPAPKPYRPTSSSRRPATSSRSDGERVPYTPKAGTPKRDPTREPETIPPTAPTAAEMVSPTSAQSPAMTNAPMPMQEYPEEEMEALDEIDAGLDDEAEDFDEEEIDE